MRLQSESTTDPDLEQERRKSDVRINVTYGVVFLYVLMASVFTGLLIAIGEVEKALMIFGSVATMAAGITGFWFGSRGTGYAASPLSGNIQAPENQTLGKVSPPPPAPLKSNENSE